MLELFATRGLTQEAVHVTRLAWARAWSARSPRRVETLNLAEAPAHPDFAYRPETGEDKFHSFAGVPIVRRERAIGVLAVQHVEPRGYDEVEIEALQTVAMVLSELIANAGLVDERRQAAPARAQTGPDAAARADAGQRHGAAASPSSTSRASSSSIPSPRIPRPSAQRVYSAFDKMREQIDAMTSQAEFGVGGEHEEVLETYKMFAYDEGWSRRINEAIDSGLTAEAAIERVQQRTRDAHAPDRRSAAAPTGCTIWRICRTGCCASSRASSAPRRSMGLRSDTILIARNLGPAELLEYDQRRLKGVILEEGSLTAHVVIVARAMGVPVLGRVRGLSPTGPRRRSAAARCRAAAALIVRPTPAMIEAFEAQLRQEPRSARPTYAALRDCRPVTPRRHAHHGDDQRRPARRCRQRSTLTGADGIGLFRTEFQFLVSATLPRARAPARGSTATCSTRPATSRWSSAPSISAATRRCPICATTTARTRRTRRWAGARCASRSTATALMKAQARALLEAAAGRTLNVMFPMVSEPWEFDAAKALFEEQRAWLRQAQASRCPTAIRYGAMLEVPALAEMLDVLLPTARFPVDRHQRPDPVPVRRRPRQPAAGRALRLAEPGDPALPAPRRRGRRDGHGVPVARLRRNGRPAAGGAGADRHRHPTACRSRRPAVGPIKAMVRSADLSALKPAMEGWLDAPGTDVRARPVASGGGAGHRALMRLSWPASTLCQLVIDRLSNSPAR